jgi:hypothetical protein
LKAAILLPSLIVGFLLIGLASMNVFAASSGVTHPASPSVSNNPSHNHDHDCKADKHDKENKQDKQEDKEHPDTEDCKHHTTSSSEFPALTSTPAAKTGQ